MKTAALIFVGWLLFILLLVIFVDSATTRPSASTGNRRFQVESEQEDVFYDRNFVVIKDTETGQEIVCVAGGMGKSQCWLTGRKLP